jgi:hypothetical protein
MDLMIGIVIGTVAVLGVLALIPVLVIGGWFVIIFGIMRLADAIILSLEQGWRRSRTGIPRLKVTPSPELEEVSVPKSQSIPVLTAP